MSEFTIADKDFASLSEQVVIVTGASSGIGLATTQILLQAGAYVVAGDLNPPPIEHANLSFHKTNTTCWEDLLGLFKLAERTRGRINHVFANAGIVGHDSFVNDPIDANGDPVAPNLKCIDVNLTGTIYTVTMGLHFLKKQGKGSIVMTASASSFQRFGLTDYCVSKHGVLGLLRGLAQNLTVMSSSIRINAVAPNWTRTGIVSGENVEALGAKLQTPDVPGRSAAMLMASEERQGQLIFSVHGRYFEIEEEILLKSVREELVQKYMPEEEDVFEKMTAGLHKFLQK